MELNNKFQEENDKLLTVFFENMFFRHMKNESSKLNKMSKIELFITPTCNQECKYCYLVKYGEGLYPSKYRNEKVILNNLELVLKWIRKNRFMLGSLEIFSGEIWNREFGTQILSIILKAYQDYGVMSKYISIPTNMDFINYHEYAKSMQFYIDEFRKLGVNLFVSASIDGKILDDKYRPLINGNKHSDDFYKKVFDFCSSNGFGYHPMVAAIDIEYWKENYDWFEYNLTSYGQSIDNSVMLLEVRDNNWSRGKIDAYLDFIDHVWKKRYGMPDDNSNDDIITYLEKLYHYTNSTFYDIIRLSAGIFKYDCGVEDRITIRLGDLAIVPCHRTSYDGYEYGKFKIKNNSIIGIAAKNPELAINVYSANPARINIKCGNCICNEMCLKQCLGSQLETTGEMFVCCDSVCDLFKEKMDFLVSKYSEYKFLDFLPHVYHENAIKVKASIDEYTKFRSNGDWKYEL